MPSVSVGAPGGPNAGSQEGLEARSLPSRAAGGDRGPRPAPSLRGAPSQKGGGGPLLSGSIRSVEGLEQPADSESLQTFFQGLMAKSKQHKRET